MAISVVFYFFAVKQVNPRLTRKALKMSSIKEALNMKCKCGKDCLKSLDINTIGFCRYLFWSKNYQGRVQWMFNKFLECRKTKKSQKFMVEGGILVCFNALVIIHKIPVNFAYNLKRKFANGQCAPGTLRKAKHGPAYMGAVEFLEGYATTHGDRMPDSRLVKLEYKTRKSHLYNRYKKEYSLAMKPIIKLGPFYRMWKSQFPHLRIKKTSGFTKCTRCRILERRLEVTRRPDKREEIIRLIEKHNHLQMMERKLYYRKRQMARMFPSQFGSVCNLLIMI